MDHFHGDVFSLCTLKRITQKLGLYRRKYKSDILKVVEFIWGQCSSHGQMYGYRWMHVKCLENCLTVSQDTVRVLLHILDPSLSYRKHIKFDVW